MKLLKFLKNQGVYIKNHWDKYVIVLLMILLATISGVMYRDIQGKKETIKAKEEKINNLTTKNIKLAKDLSNKQERIEELENKLETSNRLGRNFAEFGTRVENVLADLDVLISDYDDLIRQYCRTYDSQTKNFRFHYNKLLERYNKIANEYKEIRKELNSMLPSQQKEKDIQIR